MKAKTKMNTHRWAST